MSQSKAFITILHAQLCLLDAEPRHPPTTLLILHLFDTDPTYSSTSIFFCPVVAAVLRRGLQLDTTTPSLHSAGTEPRASAYSTSIHPSEPHLKGLLQCHLMPFHMQMDHQGTVP